MPHEVNAESGLLVCRPVLEAIQDHAGWCVTAEDSPIVTHSYAIVIDIASTAEVLGVYGQVVG